MGMNVVAKIRQATRRKYTAEEVPHGGRESLHDRRPHRERNWNQLLPEERAALLLRKLLGKVRLDPVTSLKGRPHYRATSNLHALALVEHETKEPGFPAKGSPGSKTFRWWALQDLNL